MKRTISLESMLIYLKAFNAHIGEHISDNDHNNIKHDHNQRYNIIKAY